MVRSLALAVAFVMAFSFSPFVQEAQASGATPFPVSPFAATFAQRALVLDATSPHVALLAPDTGAASALADFPMAYRAYAAGAHVGDRFLVIGGCESTAGSGPDCASSTTSDVEAYDDATGAWTTLAPLPEPRSGAGAGVIGGRAYVAGGDANCAPCDPVTSLFSYDPDADAWTTLHDMPSARDQVASAALDGKLYVAGGYDAARQPSARVDVYDPITDSWSTIAPMPTPRAQATAIAADGVLVVVGGWDGSSVVSTVEAYDPASGAWFTLSPLSTPRVQEAVVSVDGIVYAIGGWDGQQYVLSAETIEIPGHFGVASADDASDAAPGDGVCATSAGACTLRAAIEEANAHPGPDTITLGATTIALTSGLRVTDDLAIQGIDPSASVVQGCGPDCASAFRLLTIADGVHLDLSGITLREGGGALRVGEHLPWEGGYAGRASVSISRSILSDQHAAPGGAIDSIGSLTISNTTFARNEGGFQGGAINTFGAGTVEITDSLFQDDHALDGGAIFVNQGSNFIDLILTRDSFVSEHADRHGGAIFHNGYGAGGKVLITDVTFAGDSASASGGAIFTSSGVTRIASSTFHGNDAPLGAAILKDTGAYVPGAPVSVTGSILDASTSGHNCDVAGDGAPIASGGHNLDSDGSCGFASQGDISAPAELLPLGPHGGATPTFGAELGSPILDAGDPAGCVDASGALLTMDQRGAPRPVGSACDIGAVEYAPDETPDLTPPAFDPMPDVTAEATGPEGAIVSFPPPSASDNVGVFDISCDRASGELFPRNETVVHCDATDVAGNVASGVFRVRVVDTTPPGIDPHDDINLPAWDSTGTIVTYDPPAWTDVVAGSGPASCAPASGASFLPGDTMITCSAADDSGNVATSAFAVHIVPGAPPAPGSLSVTSDAGAHKLALHWDAPDHDGGATIAEYRVYRDGDLVGRATGTSFTDAGLASGSTFTYVVRAVSSMGEGPASMSASATTPALPGAPLNLTARGGAMPGSIHLFWEAPNATAGLPVLSYHIYNGNASVGETNGTSFDFADCGVGENCTFTVRAQTDAGEGAASNSASAIGTSPTRPPQPSIQREPDGSTAVYDDRNGNGTPDPGETLATIPAIAG